MPEGSVNRIFSGADDLKGALGQDLGVSSWLKVTQERIDLFAEATGDHQWIHVDPVRAADGPYGATIAHGYLTLSLISLLAAEVYQVTGIKLGVNYGLNKVRFTGLVPVGSRVRARAVPVELVDVPAGFQLVAQVIIEVEGADKPACVAETVVRYYL